MINGPEAFTPDGEFIMGERRTFAGSSWRPASALTASPAPAESARSMAEWIRRRASLDRRLADGPAPLRRPLRRPRLRARAAFETYSTYYDIHYPGEERRAGRGLERLARSRGSKPSARAFGEKAGWERPNWLEANAAQSPRRWTPRGWSARHWSTAIEAEHRAARDARGALRRDLLQRSSRCRARARSACCSGWPTTTSTSRSAPSPTRSCSTSAAGSSAILTVTHVGADRFMLVTGSAFGLHDLSWIRSHAADDRAVAVEDVTARYACLGLFGPRAREILSRVTREDVSDRRVPLHERASPHGGEASVLALRVTYVGELGWELYAPIAVRPRASGTRSGRPAVRSAWSPPDIGRSTRCVSRRATATGAPRSRPSTRRSKRGSGSASASTRATSSAATRS